MTSRHLSDLSAVLGEACRAHGVTGAAVGVRLDGAEVVACHGVTDADRATPVRPDTLFLIGSTSKTFTATAIAALADRGEIGLDDPVATHLPDLRLADETARASVTVGQLLDHTSGWTGDLKPDTGFGEDALRRGIAQLEEAEQVMAPGAAASYSNSAVMLAGHLVAVVAGMSYEEALRTEVLGPLGLHDTYLLPWEVAHRDLAVGHAKGVPQRAWQLPRSMTPAGGVISSVRDQLRWAAFHLDGGPVLSDRARLSMRTPRVVVRSRYDAVGTGWLLRRHRGTQLVEHGGNVGNVQVSSFSLAPDLGLAVTTLTNSSGGDLVGTAVLEHVLDRLGCPGQPARTALTHDAALHELVGTYDGAQWTLEVTRESGALLVRQRMRSTAWPMTEAVRTTYEAAPQRLVLVDEDVLASAHDTHRAVADVVRDGAGNVAFLRHGMRLCRRRVDTQNDADVTRGRGGAPA